MKHGHPTTKGCFVGHFLSKYGIHKHSCEIGKLCNLWVFSLYEPWWWLKDEKEIVEFLFAPQPLWLHDSSLEDLIFFKLGRWCDFIPVLYHRSSWIAAFCLSTLHHQVALLQNLKHDNIVPWIISLGSHQVSSVGDWQENLQGNSTGYKPHDLNWIRQDNQNDFVFFPHVTI